MSWNVCINAAATSGISSSTWLLARNEYMSLVGKQNSNEVIAYQLRQSFKPGEVTAEEANQIGYQEAGLQPGDTVCIGMSGSFPGLGIASIAATNWGR